MLPTEPASLMEMGAMLELLDPQRELVLIMGNLNDYTATLAPNMKSQLPDMSTCTVVNNHSLALLC